jgi:hypothetical protein
MHGHGDPQPLPMTLTAAIRGIIQSRSGADGDRTRDLMHAMHALSQLSYSPGTPVIYCESPPLSRLFFHRLLSPA